MSVVASRYALDTCRRSDDLSVAARAVLLALGAFANTDGEAWPSQALLAEVVGMTHRSVERPLRELIEAGVIAARSHPPAPPIYRFPVRSRLSTTPAGERESRYPQPPLSSAATPALQRGSY